MSTKIPKIFHQMWLSKDGSNVDQPSKDSYRQNIKDLKRLNPDFEYRWWNNREVEKLFNHPTMKKYKEDFELLTPHICKCDFARYMLLYLYGGVYFDLDFKFYKAFPENLLDNELLLFHEPDFPKNYPMGDYSLKKWTGCDRILANNILATAPGNDFWLTLMDEVVKMAKRFRDEGVNLIRAKDVICITGPEILTRTAYNHAVIHDESEWHFEADRRLFFGPLSSKSIAFNDWKDGTDWNIWFYNEFTWTRNILIGVICVVCLIAAVLLVIAALSIVNLNHNVKTSPRYQRMMSSSPFTEW